jgi:putative ABC transport system permease protein
MKKIDIAKRSYRNLRQSRVRTILTALAIAVGATTICLALAAGNGGRDYINK